MVSQRTVQIHCLLNRGIETCNQHVAHDENFHVVAFGDFLGGYAFLEVVNQTFALFVIKIEWRKQFMALAGFILTC